MKHFLCHWQKYKVKDEKEKGKFSFSVSFFFFFKEGCKDLEYLKVANL